MKQFTAILIGAGARGRTYGYSMHDMPEKFKIVGVADPHEARRVDFQRDMQLPDEAVFCTWEEILTKPKMGYCHHRHTGQYATRLP